MRRKTVFVVVVALVGVLGVYSPPVQAGTGSPNDCSGSAPGEHRVPVLTGPITLGLAVNKVYSPGEHSPTTFRLCYSTSPAGWGGNDTTGGSIQSGENPLSCTPQSNPSGVALPCYLGPNGQGGTTACVATCVSTGAVGVSTAVFEGGMSYYGHLALCTRPGDIVWGGWPTPEPCVPTAAPTATVTQDSSGNVQNVTVDSSNATATTQPGPEDVPFVSVKGKLTTRTFTLGTSWCVGGAAWTSANPNPVGPCVFRADGVISGDCSAGWGEGTFDYQTADTRSFRGTLRFQLAGGVMLVTGSAADTASGQAVTLTGRMGGSEFPGLTPWFRPKGGCLDWDSPYEVVGEITLYAK